jgi:hypothetical protein
MLKRYSRQGVLDNVVPNHHEADESSPLSLSLARVGARRILA